MPSTVTVHYPFHPLHDCCLGVIAWPHRAAGTATVQHPDGKPLKIPLWMLQPDAVRFCLSEQVEIAAITPIMASSTPADCFDVEIEAFPIELKYMIPVFYLSDYYLTNGSNPRRKTRADCRGYPGGALA